MNKINLIFLSSGLIYSLSLINPAFADNTNCLPILSEKVEEIKSDSSKTQGLDQKQIKILKERLEQIMAMDKSGLPRSERKELKKEVKQIEKKLKAPGTVIYISGGGLLLIIILLLILL